jgi:RimJ/RimL family protein N-acetyltransferase
MPRSSAPACGCSGGIRIAEVRLREVGIADLPALHAMQAEPGWTEMAGIPRRDHREFLEHRARIAADPEVVWLAVEADGELAGDVVSFIHDGRRVVGYGVVRAFWGHGVASAALRLLLDVVSERPLYAAVLTTNAASMRVLEKAGFERVESGEEEAVYELRVGG